jgi:hypothetical protein
LAGSCGATDTRRLTKSTVVVDFVSHAEPEQVLGRIWIPSRPAARHSLDPRRAGRCAQQRDVVVPALRARLTRRDGLGGFNLSRSSAR